MMLIGIFQEKIVNKIPGIRQAHLGMMAVCFFLEESWSHFLAVSPAGEGLWNALGGCLNGFVG